MVIAAFSALLAMFHVRPFRKIKNVVKDIYRYETHSGFYPDLFRVPGFFAKRIPGKSRKSFFLKFKKQKLPDQQLYINLFLLPCTRRW
jgi:hypothetical protein